jgi:hypothetical protein
MVRFVPRMFPVPRSGSPEALLQAGSHPVGVLLAREHVHVDVQRRPGGGLAELAAIQTTFSPCAINRGDEAVPEIVEAELRPAVMVEASSLRRPLEAALRDVRRQVHDDVGCGLRDRSHDRVAVAHVDLVELGVGVEPFAAASREVVENRNALSGRDEPLDEMAADESGSTW